MKKKLTAITLIGIFTFIMAGCITTNESSANYNIKEGSEIFDTYIYDVEENFNGMKLEIDLALTKGNVTFELQDPNGKIQWSDKVTPQKPLKEVKNFDKIVGQWTLIFESVDNSGAGQLSLQFNKL